MLLVPQKFNRAFPPSGNFSSLPSFSLLTFFTALFFFHSTSSLQMASSDSSAMSSPLVSALSYPVLQPASPSPSGLSTPVLQPTSPSPAALSTPVFHPASPVVIDLAREEDERHASFAAEDIPGLQPAFQRQPTCSLGFTEADWNSAYADWCQLANYNSAEDSEFDFEGIQARNPRRNYLANTNGVVGEVDELDLAEIEPEGVPEQIQKLFEKNAPGGKRKRRDLDCQTKTSYSKVDGPQIPLGTKPL
jgi:hypothetical protein